MNFDRDRSGTVEPHELQQALVTFGYNLSPQAQGVMLRRYSNQGRVPFDAFVALCVRLRILTSKWWVDYYYFVVVVVVVVVVVIVVVIC